MTTILLANDKEKTIEYAHWEALATQYGMNAEAMPEDWDEICEVRPKVENPDDSNPDDWEEI